MKRNEIITSDWACSGISFKINVSETKEIKIKWKNLRDRINTTISDENGEILKSILFTGDCVELPFS